MVATCRQLKSVQFVLAAYVGFLSVLGVQGRAWARFICIGCIFFFANPRIYPYIFPAAAFFCQVVGQACIQRFCSQLVKQCECPDLLHAIS
jgi:hypothetical protein